MNALGFVQQGLQAREQALQGQAQEGYRNALSQFGMNAPQTRTAFAAVNPVAANALQSRDQERRDGMIGKVAQTLAQMPPEQQAAAYPQMAQMLASSGIDLGPFQQYPGPDAIATAAALYGMPAAERSSVERMISQLPPELQGPALRRQLGLEPDANTTARLGREGRSTAVVGKSLVDRDTGEVIFTAPEGQSALVERIQLMTESGVPLEQAIGIATGRIREGQDEYGRTVPFDLAGGGPPPIGGAQPATDQEAPELGFDPANAFGAGSQVGRGVNIVSDFFGLGLAAPESERAASGIRAFNEGIKRTIVQAYSGRPSNFLMQNIERLLPDPDAILTGDARALDRYKALDTELAAEEQLLAQRVRSPLQGNARVEAEASLAGIQQTRQRIQSVIDGFGSGAGQGDAGDLPEGLRSRGWTPEQWQGLTPEQRNRAIELNERVRGSGAGNPSEAPVPGPAEDVIRGSIEQNAPVAPVQLARAFVGANETQHADTLSAFFRKMTGDSIDPRETAWCAAFTNAILKASGTEGTGRLNARSFLDWGTPVDQPSDGDVVVLWRESPDSWKGHVGFYAGMTEDGKVRVVGGNQSNSVSETTYPASRILGFRRPPSIRGQA